MAASTTLGEFSTFPGDSVTRVVSKLSQKEKAKNKTRGDRATIVKKGYLRQTIKGVGRKVVIIFINMAFNRHRHKQILCTTKQIKCIKLALV